ncbi:Protein kinase-like domain superfamily [Sesbania bispinosa]|nr:Protein kinase-like domain superfamily [Sesbania bispinosa]
MVGIQIKVHIFLFFSLMVTMGYGDTNPNDLKILSDFRKGLKNPELLKWPENGDDPCGPPSWPYVFCSGGRVTQIQAKNLGLKGSLPPNFNQLSELQNLGLQRNNLSGMLPTFSGLSKLQFAFLDYNEFDAIPSDFFNGLTSIRVLSLEENPLNASTGWSFPMDLENSVQLTNLSLVHCNLVGPLPDFLGTLPSLTNLRLSDNIISGGIPASFGQSSSIQVLWLNDQDGGGMTGPIDAAQVSYDSNLFCQSKPGLECAPEVTVLLYFLHNLDYPSFLTTKWSGNEPCGEPWFGLNCNHNSEVSIINLPRQKLNGTLSPSLAKLDSLLEIRLAGNNITGNVPSNFTELKSLRLLDLGDNNVEPPLPKFHDGVKVIIEGNPLLANHSGMSPPLPISSPPPPSAQPSPHNPSPSPPSSSHSSSSNQSTSIQFKPQPNKFKRFKTVVIVAVVAIFAFTALLVISLFIYCLKKKKASLDAPSSVVVHTQDPSDPEKMVKFAVTNSTIGSLSTKTGISSLTNISVMGKITTKVDVFSYGVVLMELLTGLMALDESRPEESRYLAEWFWQIKSSREKLMSAIDPALEASEETFESISIVAELAGHCTAREANHRPDMGHAVNVLSALVEKWRPVDEEFDYGCGIDYTQPLPQMLKIWKEAEGKDTSYTSLEDSKGSIPARPAGFADSFTSADAR